MRRYSGVICFATLLVLTSWLVASAQRPPQAPPEATGPRLVTLNLKDVPLADAIRQVIAATDLSVMVVGDLPREPRVTMRLREADPIATLQLLATAGNLDFQAGQQFVARGPQPTYVIEIIARPPSFPRGPGRPGQLRPSPTAAEAPVQEQAPSLPMGFNGTVDLDVTNAPFRDVIADIVKQMPENSPRVVVDESVPKDLRVTAHLRKMQLSWVLGNLITQAGLAYGTQPLQGPVTPWSYILYIVPKPELRVSGNDAR